jgi:DNA-binding MarR family transcriptional regulator
MRKDQTPRHRAELLDALVRAAPRLVADGLAFHMAVADRLGLSLADLRYLQILAEAGPTTAGDIAARTGLTTGAVTRMVDRLEQAGYVQRSRDPADRRRVVVVPDAKAIARIGSLYEGMAAAWREALSAYRDEELEVILDLFERMRELSRREAERLRGEHPRS